MIGASFLWTVYSLFELDENREIIFNIPIFAFGSLAPILATSIFTCHCRDARQRKIVTLFASIYLTIIYSIAAILVFAIDFDNDSIGVMALSVQIIYSMCGCLTFILIVKERSLERLDIYHSFGNLFVCLYLTVYGNFNDDMYYFMGGVLSLFYPVFQIAFYFLLKYVFIPRFPLKDEKEIQHDKESKEKEKEKQQQEQQQNESKKEKKQYVDVEIGIGHSQS
ncbi:hypothetical protein CYY_000658 [Polysphondylium violaceum]|uniref:Bidirectional sugar transporter SWEET n=1 Tax=Polysphondylium violaceum TaxID=133409 RepID=A0A8J4Q2D6_9MYCE|nr:hypothetical protein CYY_000658 [Polysphondylium violaceum]